MPVFKGRSNGRIYEEHRFKFTHFSAQLIVAIPFVCCVDYGMFFISVCKRPSYLLRYLPLWYCLVLGAVLAAKQDNEVELVDVINGKEAAAKTGE